MAECVARGGYGTSVTPVSQFYFQQAYANATQGPWKRITDGYGNMVLGYFGKTPVAPDPEIVKIASEQLGKPVFDGDPLEILEPGIPKATKLLEENDLPVTDENLFIVGALATKGGNKGLDFLKGDRPVNVRKIDSEKKETAKVTTTAAKAPASSTGAYTVVVNGVSYDVQVQEGTGAVTSVAPTAAPAAPAAPASGTPVVSPVPGNVLNIMVAVGDAVEENQQVAIVEAMKMENPIVSPVAGTVQSIEVDKGGTVDSDTVIMIIG